MKLSYTGIKFLIIAICLACHFPGFSQKINLSGIDLSGLSYEQVSENAVIKKGEIKCFYGDGILNELTLEGGTLLITGKVRINKISNLKGNLIVAKKASALLPSVKLNGNASIINYGSITYTGNVSLYHNNNQIINEVRNSKMNWGSSELYVGGKNSVFINNGTVDVGTLTLDSKKAEIILGPNSLINLVNLVNNYENRISIPKGIAKLSQAGYAKLPKSLTNSIKLVVCPGSHSEILIPAGGYGKANVMEKGCSSFPSIPGGKLTSVK